MTGNILVTGGAGYIGSMVVTHLLANNANVTVIDNLSTGHRENVMCSQFYPVDIANEATMIKIMREHRIDAVMHLAASTSVPESVSNPLSYYLNNTANTLQMLKYCVKCDVKHFVFSSTAAVYGECNRILSEDMTCNPITPYGQSKLMSEQMIQNVARASQLRAVILRYFNVIGAHARGLVGPRMREPGNLVPRIIKTAFGEQDELLIYGNDYATKDGTAIRDYVHVEDIAKAHLAALDYLQGGGETTICNVGYGEGHSVLDIVKSVEALVAKKLPVSFQSRRPGDLPEVIADNRHIQKTLKWHPQYQNIHEALKTAVEWQRKLRDI